MQKLSELPLRAYLGHPVIVDLRLARHDLGELARQIASAPEPQLPPEALEALPGHWDFDADASLAWPRVDHENGVCLYLLCPCSTADHQTMPQYDLFGGFGLTPERIVDQDAPDCEVIDILSREDMPEMLKARTRWIGELFEESPGVEEARGGERLDRWRDPLYPDVVSAVLFPSEGGGDADAHPWRVFARVERCAIDPDEPDAPHWEATLAAVVPLPDEEGATEPGAAEGVGTADGDLQAGPDLPRPGSRLWLGIARAEEDGEVLGLYASEAQDLGAEDYDPEVDAREDGELSLAIGARYCQEGMVSEGIHRVVCFELAEHFYQASAERGNARAMCNLGHVCSYGRLGEKDFDAAAKWFRKAAVLGNAEAACKYGDLLWQGRGVRRDDEQAYFYYQMAYKRAKDEWDGAVWGSAALRLAGCFEYGRGGERDRHCARDLCLEAEAGLLEAVPDQPWHKGQLARAREGLERLARE
ncbi:tetratricopeptide repeat protein [Olsenella phocaeensis]|uniref:tetratricopeptide repeat protein n=1 Tax=Olsenella phocaeensis TaxID=1852385 RepID=UPI003A8FB1D8